MNHNVSISTERFTITGTNHQELRGLIREVFKEHVYYFETDRPKPYIIDLGAHVGVATLYFSYIAPNAQIMAVEPNPKTFALLQQNLTENFVDNVTAIEAAVATRKGSQRFFMDKTTDQWYSTSGFEKGAWNHRQESEEITVATMTLTELITHPVDLLKMDIEGAETEVLLSTTDALRLINHLILEFHPGGLNSLERITDHLNHFGLKPLEPQSKKPSDRPRLQLIEFVRR